MGSESNFQSDKFYDTSASIAAGQTESAAIDLRGLELAGIFIPMGFSGSQIKLRASATKTGTYVPVQNGAGADVAFTVTASSYMHLPDLSVTAALRYIKLVAVSTQTNAAELPLALRTI